MTPYNYLADALIELIKKKASCGHCQALDKAIAELNPLVKEVETAHRPLVIEYIVSLLESEGRPMTAADIIDSLLATGYPRKAKSLSSAVYATLYCNEKRGVVMRTKGRWSIGPKGLAGVRRLGRRKR